MWLYFFSLFELEVKGTFVGDCDRQMISDRRFLISHMQHAGIEEGKRYLSTNCNSSLSDDVV